MLKRPVALIALVSLIPAAAPPLFAASGRLFNGNEWYKPGPGGPAVYDYGVRCYSPRLARFISADTVIQGQSNPAFLNRYAYCLNNPLRHTDPGGNEVRIPSELEFNLFRSLVHPRDRYKIYWDRETSMVKIYARKPSRGTRRNDMGAYGGPYPLVF